MKGFGRKQVMVLVAFGLAVMASLLGIPAIQTVRDSAMRTQCQTNVKQLITAMHAYASRSDDGMTLPRAAFYDPTLAPEERLSWIFMILPDLEATPFGYPQSGRWDDADHAKARATTLKTAACPLAIDDMPAGATTYAGMTGLGPDSPLLPVEHKRAGVFAYERLTRFSDIKDGQSTTMALFENGRGPAPWVRGGPGTVGWLEISDEPHLGVGRPLDLRHTLNRFRFTANARGSVIGLVDASTRYVSESVPSAVLEALVTINGGEPALPE